MSENKYSPVHPLDLEGFDEDLTKGKDGKHIIEQPLTDTGKVIQNIIHHPFRLMQTDFQNITPEEKGFFNKQTFGDGPSERTAMYEGRIITLDISRTLYEMRFFDNIEAKLAEIGSKSRRGNTATKKQKIHSEVRALWKDISSQDTFANMGEHFMQKLVALFQKALGDDTFARSYEDIQSKTGERVFNTMGRFGKPVEVTDRVIRRGIPRNKTVDVPQDMMWIHKYLEKMGLEESDFSTEDTGNGEISNMFFVLACNEARWGDLNGEVARDYIKRRCEYIRGTDIETKNRLLKRVHEYSPSFEQLLLHCDGGKIFYIQSGIGTKEDPLIFNIAPSGNCLLVTGVFKNCRDNNLYGEFSANDFNVHSEMSDDDIYMAIVGMRKAEWDAYEKEERGKYWAEVEIKKSKGNEYRDRGRAILSEAGRQNLGTFIRYNMNKKPYYGTSINDALTILERVYNGEDFITVLNEFMNNSDSPSGKDHVKSIAELLFKDLLEK